VRGESIKLHNEEVHDSHMYTYGETGATGCMHGMDEKRTHHYSSENLKGRDHSKIKAEIK
jgi:hypothetical protein